jgi:hypothetical protein
MDSGTAVINEDDGTVAFGSAKAFGELDDGSAGAMDSGQAMVVGGEENIAAQSGAGSPIQQRITEAEDEAAVGMDSSNVINHPEDSAFTTGSGAPALNDTEDFAVSGSGPAFNDTEDSAISGTGPAFQDVDNAAVGSNNVQDVEAEDRAAVSIGSGIAISDPDDVAMANNSTNSANQANDQGAVAFNSTVVTDPEEEVNIASGDLDPEVVFEQELANQPDGVNNMAAVSVNALAQVAGNMIIGPNSGNNSGTMNVNATNSSTTGLQTLSYAQGGIASNVASQTTFSVNNNIAQNPAP